VCLFDGDADTNAVVITVDDRDLIAKEERIALLISIMFLSAVNNSSFC
jgi:hypothetical protein